MTDSNTAGSFPQGKGSPDEPAATLPGESASSAQKGGGGSDAGHTKEPGNEEPEPALEPDLATDGRDEDGEAMMRDLPQRQMLSAAPPEPADRH